MDFNISLTADDIYRLKVESEDDEFDYAELKITYPILEPCPLYEHIAPCMIQLVSVVGLMVLSGDGNQTLILNGFIGTFGQMTAA